MYWCRYNSELLIQIKGQIAPPKCKVKVCSPSMMCSVDCVNCVSVLESIKANSGRACCIERSLRYILHHNTVLLHHIIHVCHHIIARDAMCWFVKLWSSLELFGMEFLSCTNTDTKENGLIGISKDRVSLMIGDLNDIIIGTM